MKYHEVKPKLAHSRDHAEKKPKTNKKISSLFRTAYIEILTPNHICGNFSFISETMRPAAGCVVLKTSRNDPAYASAVTRISCLLCVQQQTLFFKHNFIICITMYKPRIHVSHKGII